MTPQMAKALAYIRRRIGESGVSPSCGEIAAELGLGSKSGAHRIVTALVQRGYIERVPHCARSIRVIEKPELLQSAITPMHILLNAYKAERDVFADSVTAISGEIDPDAAEALTEMDTIISAAAVFLCANRETDPQK